jgi:hypothetical protein
VGLGDAGEDGPGIFVWPMAQRYEADFDEEGEKAGTGKEEYER